MNIKLIIAYDGTYYLGWQKTRMGPSIEETLERAISQVLQEKVALQAASRTDAGVHARGQVVNFFTDKKIPCFHRLQVSLNCLLPKDIAVMHAEQAADSFHPTLDCSSKEYHYSLCYGPAQLPHARLYSWHYPHCLSVDVMREASKVIVGKRDFSTFCNYKKNSDYHDYTREIFEINIEELPNSELMIKIRGTNFLYKMVRNIVGTLVYVGCGKIPEGELSEILSSKDRTRAGITAPAHGLYLYQVYYT